MTAYFKKNPYPLEFSGASVIGEEEKALVNRVLESKSLNRYYGPANQGMVDLFEAEAATFLDVPYTLALQSGTSALLVALRALGIGGGDEVLVPASTFIATATTVMQVGAVPVFVEMDESGNIDPDDMEPRITPRTKAVIAVPILGVACQMDDIVRLARRHGLFVIEDCAQSFGCKYHGQAMGTFGDIGCFSLQFCKIITAGEGGLVVTRDAKIYEKLIQLHDQGQVRADHLPAIGGETQLQDGLGENYRLDELRGAVALAQIRKLDVIIARLRANADRIRAALNPGPYRFRASPDPAGDVCCDLLIYHDGTPEQVDEWLRLVQAEGLPAGRRYDGRTVYQYPFLEVLRRPDGALRYPLGTCPRTEHLLSISSCIPIAIGLSATDCIAVADVLNGATEQIYGAVHSLSS